MNDVGYKACPGKIPSWLAPLLFLLAISIWTGRIDDPDASGLHSAKSRWRKFRRHAAITSDATPPNC
jgi:hypothetical protein